VLNLYSNIKQIKVMENTFAIEAPHGETIYIPTNFVAQNDIYSALQTNDEIKKYYEDNGYVVLRGLVPTDLCDKARKAFDTEVKPYNDFIYRQATANPEKHKFTEHKYMLNSILNVQDLDKGKFHDFNEYGTQILTHTNVQNALKNLMGEPAKMVQTMYFEGNPATWAHQDSYYLDASTLGRMVAIWVAVEDIAPGAGRFYVYPTSHKIDMDKNGGDFDIAFNHDRYKQLVLDIIQKFNLKCVAPALKKGDVLLWHGKTIHGSLKTTQPQFSRSSYTGHYIPESCDFLQYQSRIKPLNLRNVNGMKVNFPKDQNELKNQLMMKVETTFPKSFQFAKKLAIKMVTK
jgi:phytanoyl-CoA hydroxylase